MPSFKFIHIVFAAIAIVAALLFFAAKPDPVTPPNPPLLEDAISEEPREDPREEYSGPKVIFGETEVQVELATTTQALRQGLSGREELGAQSGMLFIFKQPAIHRFWMPDMNFPLDMIWIGDGTVADISENVPADFDPANPTFYSPSVPVRYVLEVNAGFAARHGIRIGDAVIFQGF